eukprot:3673089-Amphidinium_carterae.1
MDHREELTKVLQVGLGDEGVVVDQVEGNTVGSEHDNGLEANCTVNVGQTILAKGRPLQSRQAPHASCEFKLVRERSSRTAGRF